MEVLPDILDNNLKVVFCGTAVGDKSAKRGAYYAGPGNKFWEILHQIELTPYQLEPYEYHTLIKFGIGLTDLNKSQYGSDNHISSSGFDAQGLRSKIEKFKNLWGC